MSYIKEIKHEGKPVRINIDSDADESVFNEIFIEHEYKLLVPIIKNAKNYVLDIGGHKGMFSIYAGIINPQVNIFAYEPEENNFKSFKENLKTNHIKNVFPKSVAIGKASETRLLFISEDSHNHSFINEENTKGNAKVQTQSLAEIINKAEKTTKKNICDLLKIDCEGAEFEIIESTPVEILKKIAQIYIEYHSYNQEMDPQKIKAKLQSANFKVEIKKSNYDKRMGSIFATQT
jgi:FkbM family methyltransferase